MGLGGATIHCRTGLDTPYLSEEFMNLVQACIEKARELDMKIYLYDEDRWPSGAGGGEVTKNREYRARYLVFSKDSPKDLKADAEIIGSTGKAAKQGNGELLARYEIKLKDGYLDFYKRLLDNETGTNIWYAYLEVRGDDPWFNNQAYVDTLNKEAVECFIDSTYEKYKKRFGDLFGREIPSIFTDEPQFTHKSIFGKAEDKAGVLIPYTNDFEETFYQEYQISFLDHLPEIFWELPKGKVSAARYRYHDHLAERFAMAFSDTVGSWCRKNHIALTGHMMEEPTLYSQTQALGEAMRHYRGFQIPGIDMLCDWREYATAKQAQSAAHQMGSNEITSELYGVTNWDFDFRGHKQQGDWQAALGVTHRVQHLSWVSMEGEAKRDYPASISYQSPWADQYKVIENYFARINTALMSGVPKVRVGVLHPIESYWLYFGPDEQTELIRSKMEEKFTNITEWLLFGLVDFDFISEALWNSLEESGTEGKMNVGKMNYEVLVVPELHTYRSTTIRRLKDFMAEGGNIIFMGEPGRFVDAIESEEPKRLYEQGTYIEFDQNALLNALSDYRDIDVVDTRGVRSKNLMYQLRELGGDKIFFLANGKKNENPDIPKGIEYTIAIRGLYSAEIMNAFSGEKEPAVTEYKDGRTLVTHTLYAEDSLLIYYKAYQKGEEKNTKKDGQEKAERVRTHILNKVKEFSLSEPNVLMLDQAEYSLDGETYREKEEILRIDNILRKRLGYPLKIEAYAQPWTRGGEEEKDIHRLSLRYEFLSDIEQDNISLATEITKDCRFIFNQIEAEPVSQGYYVDECIKVYPLSKLKKGINELIMELPYHRWTNLEWNYLLGEFGVYIMGDSAKVVALAEKIGFSDLAAQGMAFYGGNISYICEVDLEKGEYELEISKYRSPLMKIKVDGIEKDYIFISPSLAKLGVLEKGIHRIEIISYGNRVNTFGAVHNTDPKETWYGPEYWRTKGTAYAYEYQLKKTGILAAPRLYQIKKC